MPFCIFKNFNINFVYDSPRFIFFVYKYYIQMMISIRRLKMRLYFWCLAIYMFIRIRLKKIFKLIS
jgi:hypothetical protein